MILHNGTILTMHEGMPHAAALTIAGGRVTGGVDNREDPIASAAHEYVNLQGATVVPGLVDAHVHFRQWALARARLQLTDAPTLDDLLDRVRTHQPSAGAHADWVLGAGWRDELLPRGGNLDDALEAAAGGRCVALVSKDGHALLVTARTLAHLGIDLADLDLPGGVIERTADGSFAGVLRERSAWEVRRRLPEGDLTMRDLAAAMREANRRGITGLHDMDGAAGFRTWRELDAERGLSLRVWQWFHATELEHLAAIGLGSGFGSDRLRVGGLKAFADGTLGSGTAWLHEPEAGAGESPPRDAVVITDRAELERLAAAAGDAGLPLAVHAIGDAAVTATVDALEATADRWRDAVGFPRIEHAQLMRADDMARCARLGIALSVQPSHLVTDRDVADARWGDRCDRAYAYRSMRDAGAGLLLGSDAPIEDLSPLAALQAAVTRDGGGHLAAPARGAWHAEQALDPLDALAASTSWCADSVGADRRLGRLAPGCEADLVVLSGNPLTDPIESIEVVATMVAGRWVYGVSNLGDVSPSSGPARARG